MTITLSICSSFLIRERIGWTTTQDCYDILDGRSGTQVGIVQEQLHWGVKILKEVLGKRLLPSQFQFVEAGASIASFTLVRHPKLFGARFSLIGVQGRVIAQIVAPALSLREGIAILGAGQNRIASVRGDWKGFEFEVIAPDGLCIGRISKKWGGVLKEALTTADTYSVSLEPTASTLPDAATLILAASIAIDAIYNEHE